MTDIGLCVYGNDVEMYYNVRHILLVYDLQFTNYGKVHSFNFISLA